MDAAVGGFRSGGLGVSGPKTRSEALVKGQVDELLISRPFAAAGRCARRIDRRRQPRSGAAEPALEPIAAGGQPTLMRRWFAAADELVTRARQTSAKITFIENAALLAAYGGVAAILRFKI